jgi:hypothetical protein
MTDIDDPLKPLAEVLLPDGRRANLVGTLAEEHADLDSIQLHAGVPLDVRQLFETAKNVSLYSWFVFRFHPVAESSALACLELALNLRATGLERLPDAFRSPSLSTLLKAAIESGVIGEDRFPSREAYLRQAAHMRKLAQLVLSGSDNAEMADPTEDELKQADAEVSMTNHLRSLFPTIRNAMAHGSPRLTPMSRSTLRLVSEAINQLFPRPDET